jgi:hypothetical protein
MAAQVCGSFDAEGWFVDEKWIVWAVEQKSKPGERKRVVRMGSMAAGIRFTTTYKASQGDKKVNVFLVPLCKGEQGTVLVYAMRCDLAYMDRMMIRLKAPKFTEASTPTILKKWLGQ